MQVVYLILRSISLTAKINYLGMTGVGHEKVRDITKRHIRLSDFILAQRLAPSCGPDNCHLLMDSCFESCHLCVCSFFFVWNN